MESNGLVKDGPIQGKDVHEWKVFTSSMGTIYLSGDGPAELVEEGVDDVVGVVEALRRQVVEAHQGLVVAAEVARHLEVAVALVQPTSEPEQLHVHVAAP